MVCVCFCKQRIGNLLIPLIHLRQRILSEHATVMGWLAEATLGCFRAGPVWEDDFGMVELMWLGEFVAELGARHSIDRALMTLI